MRANEATRLFGREREIGVLRHSLDRALAGGGGVVAVSGEPGIGKTTLAHACGAIAAERGVPVLWGRGVESGAPAYWPLMQLLRDRADAVDDDTLRAEAGWGAAELVRLAPEWGPRLGIERSDEDEDRLRLFEASRSFLHAAGARAGVLAVLDDMHWADQPSVRLVEHVAEGLASSRVLILIAYRSTEPGAARVVADLDAIPSVARIGLRGLPVEAVHQKLTAASTQPLTAALSAKVATITGGNPLFVTELARLLAEDVAAGTPLDDTWPQQVPATVRAVIAHRLGRVRPSTRDVLHAAAVVGGEFSIAVVAAMVRAPALTCLDALDEAQVAGLVEPADAPGRQRFVHALVRDAVVAGISASEQVRLHRAAADALEAGVDREVQPSAVAGHRATAQLALPADHHDPTEALRAADWACRAADEAMRHLAWEEAARLRRLALDLGGAALNDRARCELLIGLARAYQRCGDLMTALSTCVQAAELARDIRRPDLLADAALVLQSVGDPALSPDLQRLAEDALAALAHDSPAATRSRLLAQLAEARLYQHDEESTATYSRRALAEAETAGDRDTLLIALRARRLAALSPDDSHEVLRLADRVLELAPGPGGARHAFWAHAWRIQAWFVRGRLELISDELERLEGRADELREPLATAQVLRFRAILASARGRFADALAMAERGQRAFLRSGQASAAQQHAGFRCSVGRFTGYPEDLADALAIPPDAGGPFVDMGRTRSVLVLAGLGRAREAADEYRRLEPVTAWRLPRNLQLTAWTLRLRAAIAVDVPRDVEALIDLLTPRRGLHAGGGLSYDGPIELAVGAGAAALGQSDRAEVDLTTALDWSRAHDARPFAVEAAVELAGVLARRAGPGDVERAKTMLEEAGATAGEIGMSPFIARVRRLRSALGLGRSQASPLTAREAQVAHLVARGMTNRQIAETLVLSQRTAENHVQHILTKLGLSTRSQIAAWVATEPHADHSLGDDLPGSPG